MAVGTFQPDKMAEEKFTDLHENCTKTSDQLRKVLQMGQIHQRIQVILQEQTKLDQ